VCCQRIDKSGSAKPLEGTPALRLQTREFGGRWTKSGCEKKREDLTRAQPRGLSMGYESLKYGGGIGQKRGTGTDFATWGGEKKHALTRAHETSAGDRWSLIYELDGNA